MVNEEDIKKEQGAAAEDSPKTSPPEAKPEPAVTPEAHPPRRRPETIPPKRGEPVARMHPRVPSSLRKVLLSDGLSLRSSSGC